MRIKMFHVELDDISKSSERAALATVYYDEMRIYGILDEYGQEWKIGELTDHDRNIVNKDWVYSLSSDNADVVGGHKWGDDT